MNLKEWYASAQHCGIIYYLNKPSSSGMSAKLSLFTIVQDTQGPRLERAFPNSNGEFDVKLAKSIGYRLNDQCFVVNGCGFSRSDHLLDTIWRNLYPGVKRPFITTDLLQL